MSESQVAEAHKKYEGKWGRPPSNAKQLVAFAKTCGLSVRYGEASEHLTSLTKQKQSIHRPEPQQKDAPTQPPKKQVPSPPQYSELSREDLLNRLTSKESAIERLKGEIESLKKVTTFFLLKPKKGDANNCRKYGFQRIERSCV